MNLRERFALHASLRPAGASEVAALSDPVVADEGTGGQRPASAGRGTGRLSDPVVADEGTDRSASPVAAPGEHTSRTQERAGDAAPARHELHAPSGRGALAPDISRVRGEAYAHGVYRLFVHGRTPRRPPVPPATTVAPAPLVQSTVAAAAARVAPPAAIVSARTTAPTAERRAANVTSTGMTARVASTPAPLPAATSPVAPTPPAPFVAAPPSAPPLDPLALGPDRGGFVRRVVDWPLAPGARPALLGGALARVALPDAGRFRAIVPQLLAGVTPDEGGSPVVFLDVETTALDRGAGALAFMVGIAALVDGALRVEQWILTRLSAEAAMLAEVLARVGALAGPGAVLASFNGASFDVPLLRARLRRGGVQPTALERPHLDLLPPSRRMWRGRGPDCRLVTLERTQLGVRRVHDIAGHEIPAVFWAWLRRPDDPEVQAVMARVADHNLADLVTLPALAATITDCLRAPADLDMAIRAAEHCSAGGRRGDGLAVLEAWLPAIRRGGGSQALRRRALMLTADLLRRDLDPQGRARAALLWAEVCRISPGDPDAHEALAKHFEHHAGDLARALEVARASAAPCPRRLARLQRKLTGSRSVLVPLRSGHLCC